MMTLDDIKAAVGANETVQAKLIELVHSQAATISTLNAALAAAGNDQTIIQATVAQMQTDFAAMTAAVAAASAPPTTPVGSAPGAPVIT